MRGIFSIFCIIATLFLSNCTKTSYKEKLIFEQENTENNGFVWKYSKYENHIEITSNQKVIISEKCDSIYSISDTCFVVFVAKVGTDSLSFYDYEGKNFLSYTDSITFYDTYRFSGEAYLYMGNKDGYNGVYNLRGEAKIPFANKYVCTVYSKDNQWNTTNIIAKDKFGRKSLLNFNGETKVPFIECDHIELLIKDSEDDNIKIPLGYLFEKSDLYGIFNLNGQIVVPPLYKKIECDYVAYGHNKPYWIVYTEDEEVGLYSNNGHYIVQCGHFDDINVMTDFEKRENIWISCEKEYDEYNKKAALDTLGKTIIPLQRYTIFMDGGKWMYYDNNSQEKEYEFPKHVQNYHVGRPYNYDVTVEFYDDYIRVNGSKLTSSGVHNGWLTFEESTFGYSTMYYYLKTNYNMMYVMKMYNQWNGGYDYDYVKMTKNNDNTGTTDYSGVNNFTNSNFVGNVYSNNSLNENNEDNSRWESYYRDNYRRREDLIQTHMQTLQTLQGQNTQNATSSYSINEIKRLIRESQREMANLRNEAAQRGIIINQSNYETMSL